jgi:hypothetical protein
MTRRDVGIALALARCQRPPLLSRQPGMELILRGAPPQRGAATCIDATRSQDLKAHDLKEPYSSVAAGICGNPQYAGSMKIGLLSKAGHGMLRACSRCH